MYMYVYIWMVLYTHKKKQKKEKRKDSKCDMDDYKLTWEQNAALSTWFQ